MPLNWLHQTTRLNSTAKFIAKLTLFSQVAYYILAISTFLVISKQNKDLSIFAYVKCNNVNVKQVIIRLYWSNSVDWSWFACSIWSKLIWIVRACLLACSLFNLSTRLTVTRANSHAQLASWVQKFRFTIQIGNSNWTLQVPSLHYTFGNTLLFFVIGAAAASKLSCLIIICFS